MFCFLAITIVILHSIAIVYMLSSYIMVGSSCGYPISASNERAHIISLMTVNAAMSSAIVDESAVTVCFLLRVKKRRKYAIFDLYDYRMKHPQ